MIKKIIEKLKEREAKLFLVFLCISTSIWFISKLSNTFEGGTEFNLEFTNLPDNYMLIEASHTKLGIKLDALGFQFLGMSLFKKDINIDISNAIKKDTKYFLPKTKYWKQIEKQLPGSMKLLEVMNDTIFFDFQEVTSKKVPVKPNIQINLEQNYLLDGVLNIKPDSILIKGPKNKIDTLSYVRTSEIFLTNLTSNFSKKSALIKSENLKHATFSSQSVIISGRVSKFSEKKVIVPITILNLPKNIVIKTFPKEVAVICMGTLDSLKEIDISAFKVIADYNQVKEGAAKRMVLKLSKRPTNLFRAYLENTEVEYIVERK